MIKEINWNDYKHKDKDGYTIYYETKNPLFKDLPQYHFDRDDMCKVFDSDFMYWFWDNLERRSDEFLLTRNDDEFYIIHFPSGTIVNWYKHMGRTNTCNKDLTLDDLREFKKMLLESFGYEEVDKVNELFSAYLKSFEGSYLPFKFEHTGEPLAKVKSIDPETMTMTIELYEEIMEVE